MIGGNADFAGQSAVDRHLRNIAVNEINHRIKLGVGTKPQDAVIVEQLAPIGFARQLLPGDHIDLPFFGQAVTFAAEADQRHMVGMIKLFLDESAGAMAGGDQVFAPELADAAVDGGPRHRKFGHQLHPRRQCRPRSVNSGPDTVFKRGGDLAVTGIA
ncbi:hypothetical protein SDC9_140910 [bioreactor metagenome]|uniref:Uncharacterized protein n=1 Tax=bioreactor metagenome TaxID=1076179 RepID=A0A645DXB0_9ZZZZ